MANEIIKHPVQEYLKNPAVVNRTEELLKNRAGQFLTSVMAAINNVANLDACVPSTVYAAAITAASLDLPINNNLGFAYLIPYKNKSGNYEAQFQMGYKGFIQLAQRTGLYKQISATEVYEGQLVSEDPLNGNTYNWKAKTSENIIGYVAKFRLVNGFEHELYMPIEKMKAHGKRYSQSFKKNYGPWQDDFDVMAIKTVLKLLISKFGPLSVELQKAIERDQAIIKDNDKGEIEYVDASKEDAVEIKVGGSQLFSQTPERIQEIKDVILSEESKEIDGSDARNDTASASEPEKPKEQAKVVKKAANKQSTQNDTAVTAEVSEVKTTTTINPAPIIKSFEAIGIYQETLERYMRKPASEWSDANLADLKTLGAGLKKKGVEGVKAWIETFEKTEAEVKELFGDEPKKEEELTFGND